MPNYRGSPSVKTPYNFPGMGGIRILTDSLQWANRPTREGVGTGTISLGPHEALTLLPFWVASSRCFFIFRFPLDCLHSMSKRLGRIISNAFTVLVSCGHTPFRKRGKGGEVITSFTAVCCDALYSMWPITAQYSVTWVLVSQLQ